MARRVRQVCRHVRSASLEPRRRRRRGDSRASTRLHSCRAVPADVRPCARYARRDGCGRVEAKRGERPAGKLEAVAVRPWRKSETKRGDEWRCGNGRRIAVERECVHRPRHRSQNCGRDVARRRFLGRQLELQLRTVVHRSIQTAPGVLPQIERGEGRSERRERQDEENPRPESQRPRPSARHPTPSYAKSIHPAAGAMRSSGCHSPPILSFGFRS